MSDGQQDPDAQFNELLQELRVGLPGVQVLLAFLLVVPFSAAFDKLSDGDRAVFFGAVLSAATASILLIAPSAHHRFAWPLGPRGLELLLRIATWEARAGLVALGVAISASVYVVADLVFGSAAAWISAAALATLLAVLWIIVPLASRGLDPEEERRPPRP